MGNISWNPSYTVKVGCLDDDHKHLLSLTNTLHQAISDRKGAETVQPILHELEDYTTHHFYAEESMMEKTKFPGLESHRAEHRKFWKEMAWIQQGVLNREGGLSLATVVLLHDWWVNHILQTDKQYTEHLNANGLL